MSVPSSAAGGEVADLLTPLPGNSSTASAMRELQSGHRCRAAARSGRGRAAIWWKRWAC